MLTVISHELGHVLGLRHDDQGVMQTTLAAGDRQLLSDSDRDETGDSDLLDTDLLDVDILDALVDSWADKKTLGQIFRPGNAEALNSESQTPKHFGTEVADALENHVCEKTS